ncbi:MAG: 50S ribosomal protein L6 [Vicinamibacteria bacterium]|nr:50S ribosomal protein L6 [Vicinamibacteria bacterium]
MSRIGLKPIPIPANVKVGLSEDEARFTGPLGELSTPIPSGISFALEGESLVCRRQNDDRQQRALHGLARALASNAVMGVTRGFSKELDIVGVGYRAAVDGRKIVFALGYSHPVEYPIPEGVKIAVDRQTHIVISGIDRQKVGQTAAEIRGLRKPDPYKQKGIRYVGETLKKKAGKAGATGRTK